MFLTIDCLKQTHNSALSNIEVLTLLKVNDRIDKTCKILFHNDDIIKLLKRIYVKTNKSFFCVKCLLFTKSNYTIRWEN